MLLSLLLGNVYDNNNNNNNILAGSPLHKKVLFSGALHILQLASHDERVKASIKVETVQEQLKT